MGEQSQLRKQQELEIFANKMPETTVPVSLRDAFLEDPFFRTGWDEMNSECRDMRSFAEGNNTLATMDRSWPLLPKQWMLPQLFQDFHLPEMKDSLMLGLQEEKDKMEVTLDTSGYKPDELKVEIKGGELCVEGKHEERSQSGEVMVSRQFSRRFGLPQNVKKEVWVGDNGSGRHVQSLAGIKPLIRRVECMVIP